MPKTMPKTAPILQTIGLEKRFGGILAAQNVNLTVEPGARHALIGPNGAGKTTVINLLTGVLRPTAGRIELEGRDITGCCRTSGCGSAWRARSRSINYSSISRRSNRSV